MKKTNRRTLARSPLVVAILAAATFSASHARQTTDHRRPDHEHDGRAVAKHVILISFDGLHEQDVARCVASNACPNIALLAKDGITYTNAHTPGLSDSFPGLAALVTGGSPKTTGSVLRRVVRPHPVRAVRYQTCTRHARLERRLRRNHRHRCAERRRTRASRRRRRIQSAGDSARERSTASASRVYPHDYVKTNTVFEVVKASVPQRAHGVGRQACVGLRLAQRTVGHGRRRSDAHRDQLDRSRRRTPNYTDIYTHTEVFDDFHVQALINQIDGKNSTRRRRTRRADASSARTSRR